MQGLVLGTITSTSLREDAAMVSITVAGEGCVQLHLRLSKVVFENLSRARPGHSTVEEAVALLPQGHLDADPGVRWSFQGLAPARPLEGQLLGVGGLASL